MRRFFRRLLYPCLRRAAVVVSLLAYVAAQVGFPVLVSAHSSSRHVRPCGCVVTDDCQTCCCSAKKSTASGGCCAEPKAEAPSCPACCTGQTTKTEPDTAGCPECEKSSAAQKNSTKKDDGARVSWVIGTLSQNCQGLRACWIALGAAVPVPDLALLQVDSCAGERLVSANLHAVPRTISPPIPPPRALAG